VRAGVVVAVLGRQCQAKQGLVVRARNFFKASLRSRYMRPRSVTMRCICAKATGSKQSAMAGGRFRLDGKRTHTEIIN
jgi:hypothetical protein